jgi:LysM repeat protein
MMAFRSSEQLTSQIPLILRSAGQQRQMPAASGSTGIDRQPASTVADVSADSVFVVLKDDTLQRIALRYGVPLKALVAANPDVHDPDILRVGQKIRLPIRVAGSQR